MTDAVYEQLAAPFDHTFTDNRGGVELEYVTGEQVTTRLNDVLGPSAWNFRVILHGFDEPADEYWVLGEMGIDFHGSGVLVVRQQFGSQKAKRSRASGVELDVGFDLKGACTDCLKKCASLFGVGLYLSHKDPQPVPGTSTPHRGAAPSRPAPVAPETTSTLPDARETGEVWECADCQTRLTETKFKDGTAWSPAQLAEYGRKKHGRALCMTCYRVANEAKKAGGVRPS